MLKLTVWIFAFDPCSRHPLHHVFQKEMTHVGRGYLKNEGNVDITKIWRVKITTFKTRTTGYLCIHRWCVVGGSCEFPPCDCPLW